MTIIAFLEQNQSFADALANYSLTDRSSAIAAAFGAVLPEDPAQVNEETGRRLFDALLQTSGATVAVVRNFLADFKARLEAEYNMAIAGKSLLVAVDIAGIESAVGKSVTDKVYIPPAVPPAIFAVLIGAGLYYGTRYVMAHYGPFGPPWWRDIFYEP